MLFSSRDIAAGGWDELSREAEETAVVEESFPELLIADALDLLDPLRPIEVADALDDKELKVDPDRDKVDFFRLLFRIVMAISGSFTRIK